MKLEEQVCSLELSKRLKELGVRQESLYYWAKPILKTGEVRISLFIKDCTHPQVPPMYPYRGDYRLFGEEYKFCNNDMIEIYSAFTVAELGEMLPQKFINYKTDHSTYLCGPSHNFRPGEPCANHEDKTEADARAKCLIYLLKNKLI